MDIESINKKLIKYQKKCRDYGVNDTLWLIGESSNTEVKIIIPPVSATVPVLTIYKDENGYFHAVYFDDDCMEPVELTALRHKSVTRALDVSFDWIVSNIL